MSAPHDDEGLRRAFEALSDGASFRDDCPSPERLYAGAHGELPREDVDALTAHMAGCGACAAAWRVARSFGETQAAFETPRAITPSRSRLRPEWMALAATLVAAVGLGVWSMDLQQRNQDLQSRLELTTRDAERRIADVNAARAAAEARIADLAGRAPAASAPVVNLPMLELSPDSLRGGPDLRVVNLAPEASHVGVMMSTTTPARGSVFALEAVNSAGLVVWRADGLRKNEFDTFTAAIPRTVLPAGSYRLRLMQTDATPARVIQEYALQIRTR